MKLTKLTTTAIAVAATLGALAVAVPADAAPQPVAPQVNCGWKPANNQNTTGKFFTADRVNIRSGNSTKCKSLGLGSTSHNVTLHCLWAPGGQNWWFLKDDTTGKTGWSVASSVGAPPSVTFC